MSRKRFKPEEIVNKLREADVLLSQGKAVTQVCKQIGITDQTYYRWRRVLPAPTDCIRCLRA